MRTEEQRTRLNVLMGYSRAFLRVLSDSYCHTVEKNRIILTRDELNAKLRLKRGELSELDVLSMQIAVEREKSK